MLVVFAPFLNVCYCFVSLSGTNAELSTIKLVFKLYLPKYNLE